MPKLLEGIIRKLSGGKEGVLPSAQAFPPIDAEQIARELKLRAASEGVTDLEIRSAVELQVRRSIDAFRSQLELYDGRIRKARIVADLALEIQAAGEGALADFKVQTVDELNRLHELKEDLEEHDAEMRRFRTENRLTRPPRDVSPGAFRLGISLIVLFVVIETIFNGVFFAQGSELGLIGGIVEAVVLAVLNVGGAALFATYCLPYLVHRHFRWKLLGYLSLIAYLAWAVGLNLAVAHYRDIFAEANGPVAAIEVTSRMADSPFQLQAAQSWILGMLGALFSLATVIDVLSLRDRYPGYGLVGKQRRIALGRYTNGMSHSLQGFQSTRDDAVAEMTVVVTTIRESQYDLELSVVGRSRLIENLKAYLEHARLVYVQLSDVRHSHTKETDDTAGGEALRQQHSSAAWIGMPDVTPVLPNLSRESDAAVVKMETLISLVNEHFVSAAGELVSLRSILKTAG